MRGNAALKGLIKFTAMTRPNVLERNLTKLFCWERYNILQGAIGAVDREILDVLAGHGVLSRKAPQTEFIITQGIIR